MKGVIFNAVEEAVVSLYDEDTWDDLLDAAELSGEYTSLGNYDDADLLRLVEVASEATGIAPVDLVRALGAAAFPSLVARLPESVDGVDHVHQFLYKVNEIIHPEVLKLYPNAKPPAFDFEERGDGTLRVTYSSARKLGVLAEGLIHGAAAHFDQVVDIAVVSGAGEEQTVFDVTVIAEAKAA